MEVYQLWCTAWAYVYQDGDEKKIVTHPYIQRLTTGELLSQLLQGWLCSELLERYLKSCTV